MEKLFNIASDKLANSYNGINNEVLIQLYGLYKQIKKGPNNNNQPTTGSLRERIKWSSWKEQYDKSKETAMREYIDITNQMFSNKKTQYKSLFFS